MFDVKIKGLQETRRALIQARDQMSQESDLMIDEAAQKFIEFAQKHVRKDEERLMDSISILKQIKSYEVKQVQVGVDLNHIGTRAPTVEQYASIIEKYQAIHDGIGYIDYAQMEVEKWLKNRAKKTVEQVVRGVMSGLFGRVSKFLKGLFGR